ncbi:MAG: peptidoglycan D,D-transpeptidase FtsI family protein [Thermoleophilaceae bacterium]
MNLQIRKLSLAMLVLFAVLVGGTSWWTVVKAKSTADNPLNRRPLLEEQQIPRGLILARNGTRLAVNKRQGSGETKRYFRSYPQDTLFSHAIGYEFISHGSAGIEKQFNSQLQGQENEFKSIVDEFSGGTKAGDDIQTTLDPAAQRVAEQALGPRKGAIVALDPSTGRVRVMLSYPQYNPNLIPREFKTLNRDANAPLFNRATQSGYPPGSTFKVVTAAAALDTGQYTPDSQISGKNNKVISGVPLQNFGGEDFSTISLTDALTKSVNTVFGEIGEKLGKKTMYKYMRRFGFNQEPPLQYPSSQIAPSGVYNSRGRLLGPTDPVDIGRVAIGQERLKVTPLQMAMVAAAVANGGKLMKPRLVEKVVDPDGRTVTNYGPQKEATVMSAQAAGQLAQMMTNVVQSGTGTAAALQGIKVAGKTGTAEVANGAANQAWFIAFAPVDNPKVAIAVTVERTTQSLTGGEVAAPIAKQVMQTLLRENG